MIRSGQDSNRGSRSHPSARKRALSACATNLRKISRVLQPDMLATALGVSEDTLSVLISGRDQNLENSYSSHLAHRLEQAKLPPTLLQTPDVQIRPEHITKLRNLASSSSNKAPLRRENFRKLVKAFEDKIDVLADALEMNSESVLGVANGHLELNEQRVNHINPRLMQAGFIDGWLEEISEDALNESEVIRLEKLASDLYEDEEDYSVSEPFDFDAYVEESNRALKEAIEASIKAENSFQSAKPTKKLGTSKPKWEVAAEKVSMEKLGVDVRERNRVLREEARKAEAEVIREENRILAEANRIRKSKELKEAERVSEALKKKVNYRFSRADSAPNPDALPLSEALNQLDKKVNKEHSVNELDNRQATPPVPGIPRGAVGAGRSSIRPVKPAARKAAKDNKSSASSSDTSTPRYSPGRPLRARKAIPPAQVRADQESHKAQQEVEAALAKPETSSNKGLSYGDFEKSTSARGEISLKQSMVRVNALDSIFKDARRGAIVTLWRDLIGSNQAMWGNIRRGAALFRDDLARKAEQGLELPEGWLDNPTYPPATLADWVTDSDVPRPTELLTKAKDETYDEAKPEAVVEKASQPVKEVVSEPLEMEVEAKPEDSPSSAEEVKPESREEEPIPKRVDQGFIWKPATNPTARETPGPVVDALTSVIASLNKEGTFTDQDALRLLNQLMS